MCGDDLDYVELAGSSIQERHVKIDDIIADPNIRHFKPKSRKCKFMNEYQQDGYYDVRMKLERLHFLNKIICSFTHRTSAK